MKKARLSGSERPGPDQGRQQPAGVPSRGEGGQQEEMLKDTCSLWVMQRCPVTEVGLHNEMC